MAAQPAIQTEAPSVGMTDPLYDRLVYLDCGEIFYVDEEGDLDGEPVCGFRNRNHNVGELMATAPELLERLEALLFAIQADNVEGLGQWVEPARATVAKARGGSL